MQIDGGMAGFSGKRPTVVFLGVRGIGAVQGGPETHVTKLVEHLPLQPSEIEVVGRLPYRLATSVDPRVIWLWSPRSASLEAIVHSTIGIVYAAFRRPGVLHIHAIGPSLLAPFARLAGLKVVVTHHGEDYRRDKWGPFARRMLRLGEWCGARFAHACIAVSPADADSLRSRFRRDVAFIPNGVDAVEQVAPGAALQRFGLEPHRYVLNVARIVPEKRQIDLLRAFRRASLPGVKLVLIGGVHHESAYARLLREEAETAQDVVLTGELFGETLAELFTNAGVFVLPSALEGLSIALLEAMSYGIHVFASDLPVHRRIGLPKEMLFKVGDIDALSAKLQTHFVSPVSRADWSVFLRDYQWKSVAAQTAAVYAAVLGGRKVEI